MEALLIERDKMKLSKKDIQRLQRESRAQRKKVLEENVRWEICRREADIEKAKEVVKMMEGSYVDYLAQLGE